ncbi:DUF4838 domain-containing protein [Kiritimatiellaeota bacterium B1221]|nr:DUF4838 domain-containing protein [Kiritimatiellaeota bacterium B1221]
MRQRFFIFIISFVLIGNFSLEASEWQLKHPGERPLIVLPEEPTPTEVFAASELRRYLKQITAVSLEQVKESEMGSSPAIHIGRTRSALPLLPKLANKIPTLQTDSLLIEADKDSLYLLGGGDRGTLYAVYAFLENQGCRWFEPGPEGEMIPSRNTIQLPDSPHVQRPTFAVREIGRGASSNEEVVQLIDWMAKNRLNRSFGLRTHPEWQKRGGQVLWQHICHNSPWLLTNERWFKTHPEYFSLFNGRRIPQEKEGGYLCTTNPEVQQLVAEYIINWFDRHPEGDAVPISPPDGDVKWCECENCMALGGVNFATGAEGLMTRRQVEFINAVARIVAQKHPDRYIVNLAYARNVWTYEGVKTEPNVINQIAHGYAGNGSMVQAIDTERNREARDIFKTWAESGGGGIGIWDYFILHVSDQSGSPLTPLGFGRVADRMVDYLNAFPNPYKVYFTQAGDELHRHNAFLYYFLARKIWNPEQTLSDLRNDYTTTLFGDAAAPAAAYLTLLDQAYADSDWDPPIWREITVPSAKVFTPDMLEKGFLLLEELQKNLPKEASALARSTLDRMRQSLRYAETTVLPKQLVASDDGVWHLHRNSNDYEFNPGAPADQIKVWTRIRDLAIENGFMDASMARVLFRTRSRKEPIVWLENDRLRLGVLPGVGGRLIRLIDRKNGQNLFYEPLQLVSLQDPGATYFRYGGYEEYSRKDFASPGWELAMTPTLHQNSRGQQLLLEATTPEQIHIRRRILVGAGASPYVDIQTTLTNRGDKAFPAMIRVHPEFRLSEELSRTALVWNTASGDAELRPTPSLAAADELQPHSWWGLLNLKDGRGILNHFPSQQAKTHVHLDRVFQSANLELFGNAKTLAPGESLTLQHRYQVIAEVSELPGDLQSHWQHTSSIEEAPLQGITPVDGKSGQGIRLLPNGTPQLGTLGQVLENEGSFAVWAALDLKPEDENDAILFSAGSRQPDYTVLAIREGKLVFYRTQRKEGTEVAYLSWLKVDAELHDWQPGEWHHIVVNWRKRKEGSSEVEFYVDGKRLIRRNDLDMRTFIQPMRLALGWDSSNAQRPKFPGKLDEVRIFPTPLDPRQARALFQSPNLQPETSTLILDFEDIEP